MLPPDIYPMVEPTGSTIFAGIMSLVAAVGGGTAFWQYWKDRKKNKAEGTVATATIELQIDNARMNNLEHRFALSERAWDAERESLNERIRRVEGERDAAYLQLEDRSRTILELQERVATLAEELRQVSDKLAALQRNSGDAKPPPANG